MEITSLVSRAQFPEEVPLSKNYATSLNAEAKQSAEASREDGGEDVQRVLREEDDDALDPDQDDYVDAELAPGDENLSESVSQGAMPLVSGVDNEDYCDEDECDSVESYNSALEVASAIDAASIAFSCNMVNDSPLYETLDASQQNALRQLNQLNTGLTSMDTSLLENVSQNAFRGSVMQLVEKHRLNLEDEAVETILSALFPVVGLHFQGSSKGINGKEQDVQDGDGFEDAPSTKSTEINGDEDVDRQGICEAEREEGEEANDEASYNNKLASHAANGPSTAFEHDLLMEVDEAREADVEKDIPHSNAGEATLETHKIESQPMKETICREQEPEIIEWDDVDGSEVDDFPYINGFSVPKELQPSKETESKGTMDDSSLQQTSEIAEMDEAVMYGAPVSSVDSAELHGLTEAALEGGLDKGEPSLVMIHPLAALNENTIGSIIDEERVEEVCEFDKEKAELTEERRTSSLQVEHKTLSRSGSSTFEDGKPQEEVSEGEAECRSEALNGQEKSTQEGDLKGAQEAREGAREMSPRLQGKSDYNVNSFSKEEEQSKETAFGKEEEVIRIGTIEGANEKDTQPLALLAAGVVEQGHAKAYDTASTVQESLVSSLSSAALEGGASEEDATKYGKMWNNVEADTAYKTKPEIEKISPLVAVEKSKSSAAPSPDSASMGDARPPLPVRPAGLGQLIPSLAHAPRAVQRGNTASARQSPVANEERELSSGFSEGTEDAAQEKLQMIRVKFLRLAHRLGQSANNVVVAQVLYRLGLAEQLHGGRETGRAGAFSFERATALAEEQEAAGSDDLEFGCTIMVLGKSGVGKSATINSLFDEIKSETNAFSPSTNKVREITGTVHGVKIRVIDTPGLLTSFADQRRNERIMSYVKSFIKNSPPDIVLYFDRLDMQSRDYGDLPLLRTITNSFGSAIWFNAIVVLTHASSAPPDGANGVPISYEMFVAQRSHVVQQTIRQAAGDMRLMNPVSIVENHVTCRRNRAGQCVLPNGQVWRPQLLLLCLASKILAEANFFLKLQDSNPGKPFGVRSRGPPLPLLLSSLLQSRSELDLPDEQLGDDDESDEDSGEEANPDGEEDYDDLPPFRRLVKDELKLLDKDQKRIYFEELEYREMLFMKKQLKDEQARRREMKRKLAALPKEVSEFIEERMEEDNSSAPVPVAMPDMALPPSFDSDNPTYRYRYLDTANQWLIRPVLETHGWDHDSGYDGLNVEKVFVVSKKIPASVSGQITKDKKEASLQMECTASFKNGDGKVTQAGLDVQTIGEDLAYTMRSETRFNNFKRNKTTCGLAITLLGDTVAAGMKIEDQLSVGKRLKLVVNGGTLTGQGDVAYGGSLEATLRDKDYPLGQFLSTLGLSIMNWHGDFAIGGNVQVQFKVGKAMMVTRGNLNNRGAGQVSVRVSSSEQLQMALIGLIPLLRTLINDKILGSS